MTALVVYLQNTMARLRERQEGQTMAEYALILGGIAVVVIAGILILGPAIQRPLPVDRQLGHQLPELVGSRTLSAAALSGLGARRAAAATFARTQHDRVLSESSDVPMM